MNDQFFYLQLKFIPKIGHTFTDEREVVVEVPKDLVQRKSESINESLMPGLANKAMVIFTWATPRWLHQAMLSRSMNS